MPIFIGLHMLKEERSTFKTLCDLEMIVADILIVGSILGPDPRRFKEFHRFHQFSIKAKVTGILEIAIILFLPLPRGMPVVINMFVIIGTLPEADVVDDQLQVAPYCLSDRLQSFELPIDVFIDDNLLHTHLFVLEGFAHGIDPGRGGNLDLKAWEAFPHQIDQVRDTHND
jgi:hypothetical protein